MKRGRPKGTFGPARPGVRFRPLTPVEIGTLRALSEGMTPTQIAAETKIKNARTVWRRLKQIEFKLGAFTKYEMMFLAGKKRIID
jgi:DNA-binding NarL/FixJ family response regulator